MELRNHLLGSLSSLQVHHIFPRALLYKHGYRKSEVNAIANFTFLTQDTNLKVSDKDPTKYLSEYAQINPGVLESHWIPMDPELWKVESFPAFLAARRELLAQAANDFLGSLIRGSIPEVQAAVSMTEREQPVVLGSVKSEEEELLLLEVNTWVVEQGLPEGELVYELLDEETVEPVAILDLAWPNGLQEGYSQPIALLIDEERDTEELVNRFGYRYFTTAEELKGYVEKEILSEPEPVLAGSR